MTEPLLIAPRQCENCGHAMAVIEAVDVEQLGRSRAAVLGRLAWGLTWRYAVLGALFVYASFHAAPPWLALLAVVAVGVVLGLHRRRWVIARLWRTVVVAGTAVFVAPLTSLYPDVLAGSLGALALAPLVSTWRRRNS